MSRSFGLLFGAILASAAGCNLVPDTDVQRPCDCVGSCVLPDDLDLDLGEDGILRVVDQRVGSASECTRRTARQCAVEDLPVFAAVCASPDSAPLPRGTCECAGFCDGPAGVTLRVAGPMTNGDLCALSTASVCAGRGEAVIEARCDALDSDDTACLCQGTCEDADGTRVLVAQRTRSAASCLQKTSGQCGPNNVASANCLTD